MSRAALPLAAFLADRIAGDPEWLPHPVRWMGAAIERGERLLRRPGQRPGEELVSGALLAVVLVAASHLATRLAIRSAYRRSRLAGTVLEVVLGWTTIASRSLECEARAVLAALDAGEIGRARRRLARIVGRDTAELDAGQISRAVIETLAESASDGVLAPLLYLAAGGAPLAMAFKAVSTLDSMIGHADERYLYFGRFAARLDDVANYLPARLTALATVASAAFAAEGDSGRALRIWRRDRRRHRSPNAGQPESAMAGALGVALGGGNSYGGRFVPAPVIGGGGRPPAPADARRALRITTAVAFLGAGAAVLAAALAGRRRRA